MLVDGRHGSRARSRVGEAVESLRREGARATAEQVRTRIWGERVFFALRCDLQQLPEVPAAKVPLAMAPGAANFRGFRAEEVAVTGDDREQVAIRERARAAGVPGLHIAFHDAAPAYCQWLVRPRDQDRLAQHEPGAHQRLGEDEVLLEWAYTFAAFRRMGAMADGMSQLLHIARDEGFRVAFTYVEDSNVASLRGCRLVGFYLDHCRIHRWRLGRHRRFDCLPSERDRLAWNAAVAPRA